MTETLAPTVWTAPRSAPYAGKDRWILRLLPSFTDLAALIPVIFLVYLLPQGVSLLLSDGDTAWHIRTGEWILRHHAVPHVDLFSFTKPGQPWFAWEWGWDVIFALIHGVSGLAGVVFANVLILAVVAALYYRLVRAACDNDAVALVVTAAGLLASVMHWLARPHLLSWLLLLLLLHLLFAAERGRPHLLRWTPLLLLFWTNVHGSFFLGLLLLYLAAAGQGIGALSRGASLRGSWAAARPFALWSLAASTATLVNPYGWRVHAHIAAYLSDGTLMNQIQEFQSPDFHHFSGKAFELLLLPGLAACLWCAQKQLWTPALAIALWSHFALLAARNMPLFAFIAGPWIAAMLAGCGKRFTAGGWMHQAWCAANGALTRIRPFERVERTHLVSAIVLAHAGVSMLGAAPTMPVQFPKTFPASALPVIERVRPQRIFTTDQWGDYLLYALPGTKVYIDGRSDFYGTAFVTRCRNIMAARWDWSTDLDRFSVDMVIVPPDTPLATALKSSPHWSLLFDDGSLTAFSRHAAQGATNSARIADKSFNRCPQRRNEAWSRLGLQVHYYTYERRCS